MARCRWEYGFAPRYCAGIEITSFSKSKPEKYHAADCVVEAKILKISEVKSFGEISKNLKVGNIIDLTTAPSNCQAVKGQVGKLVNVELETICNDVIREGKIGAPSYDILKDPVDCKEAGKSGDGVISENWQNCATNSDCEIYGLTCGGVAYNKVHRKDVLDKLSKGFLCKQLLPEYIFVSSCKDLKCTSEIERKTSESPKY